MIYYIIFITIILVIIYLLYNFYKNREIYAYLSRKIEKYKKNLIGRGDNNKYQPNYKILIKDKNLTFIFSYKFYNSYVLLDVDKRDFYSHYYIKLDIISWLLLRKKLLYHLRNYVLNLDNDLEYLLHNLNKNNVTPSFNDSECNKI